MSQRHRLILKIGLLCLLSWPLIAWIAARLLITEAPLDSADAIVVLSGSASYRERAVEAAKLFREGRSARILLTHDNGRGPWSRLEQRNPFFYELSLEELKRAGVPAQSVDVLTKPVSSTQGEAEVIKEYAADHQLSSILVVTSPYHSRRALWIFNNTFAGTHIRVGLARVPQGSSPPSPVTWWLTARGWRLIPTEYGKMIWYLINRSL